MFGRQKLAMVVAEFIGTFTLASAVLAMAGRTSFPFFVAAAAGSTFALMVLILGAASEAHINPAVTIGLWTLKKIETTRAIVYVAAQMLGGVAAWKFIEYLLNAPLKNIAGAKFDWRVFAAEAVGTFIFTFGVAAVVYQGFKGLRQAVALGSSLAAGIMVATFASNGSLNPAVAVGIHSWNLTYVVAPIAGSIVAMNLYALLFAPATSSRRVAAVSATKLTAKKAKKTTKKPARRKK